MLRAAFGFTTSAVIIAQVAPAHDTMLAQWLNAGGFAVMGLLLFMLHRDSLQAFRNELAAERQTHSQQLTAEREATALREKSYLDLKLRQHEDLVERMTEHKDLLQQIHGHLTRRQ